MRFEKFIILGFLYIFDQCMGYTLLSYEFLFGDNRYIWNNFRIGNMYKVPRSSFIPMLKSSLFWSLFWYKLSNNKSSNKLSHDHTRYYINGPLYKSNTFYFYKKLRSNCILIFWFVLRLCETYKISDLFENYLLYNCVKYFYLIECKRTTIKYL